ncbi:glycerate kinase [Candidatus Desantisbacteria bacterium CG1_02_38_46]|uniref:Glycerate kinase n=3 Tax=unclassified Candidatus Desantisiibacteriota TaxID=3106372 RepID=A0A2H9PB96_9BACT|nr:MAG: glycerate kinase [Candidatus Desantisbacteria bacterium CG1_02_38_46]PIU51663.1 MAG: glycerate kinase [Candidatus Desantisbacteria bacterium CG07_land_8_20_14_0_80_39_15]PIZ15975.1 MAG: glycerate kinase [Candidatus Desantisbacteria bacterium CG_4_10_14_0_8_um_filter_39_17]
MKILVAPNSFKGSCSAINVTNAIEKGILNVLPYVSIEKIPLSDGGDGFLQTSKFANRQIKIYRARVTGPLGKEVNAHYGILGDTAIIEMAQASGLHLIAPEKRNPFFTTTYGTGQLIKLALNRGARKIIIGVGGSATVDGGAGCLQALGVKFIKKNGKEIGFGGRELSKISRIDPAGIEPRVKDTEFIIACDVQNPLTGSRGAAYIYGPQKGANPGMVKILDEGLHNYARVIKKDIGMDVESIKGGGAAGGIGAGLVAIAGAKLKKGIKVIADLTGLGERIKKADLVITGEGKIDNQTIYGKAPIGVAKIAKRYNIPVVAICGSTGEGYEAVYKHGIDVVASIMDSPMEISRAMKEADFLIEKATERFFRRMKQ